MKLKDNDIEYLNLLLLFYNLSDIHTISCTTPQDANSYKRVLLCFKAWWPALVQGLW